MFVQWLSLHMPSAARALILVACVTLLGGQPDLTVFAEDRIRFWLVFNLPSLPPTAPQPALDGFLEEWARQGVDLYDLQAKASANDEFRRQLFGQDALLRQLALFRTRNRAFPGIDVRFFGWDEYWESIRSAPEALRPDLLQIPTTWCSSLARGLRILSALPDETRRAALRRYDRQQLEPCLVYGDSPLYGLPWLVDVRVLYFWRKDLPSLEKELRNSRHPRDSFRRSLQSARATVDHSLFGLPTARDWELLHQLALLVWGEEGELIETRRWMGYRSHAAAFKEPALRGAEYLLGLAKDGLIVLPRETRQELERQFVEHRLGSIISGPWLLSQLEGQHAISDGSVGVVLPPFYEGEPVTFAGGSVLGVTGRSPSLARRALDLGEYLSAGEGALPSALAAGLLPASRVARGTAAGAIQKQAELVTRGTLCSTYFECMVAAKGSPVIAQTFEEALRAGRNYPSIPDWWMLEVPSRLGSLYHFWQELAALQSRDSLEGSLDAVSEEWDASLLRFHRAVILTSVGAMVVLLIVMLDFLWARRSRGQLKRRETRILDTIQYLESQIARERSERADQERALKLLQAILSEVQKKEHQLTAPVQYVKGKIEDLVAPLQPERDHFEITLPTLADRQLRIIKNGRAIENIDGMAARIIERVVRESLLERHRVSFSLLLGALHFWPTREDLPKDARGRWEQIVNGMRRAFDSEHWEVISKGKNTVYEFLLDESSYECYLGDYSRRELEWKRHSFVTDVRAPYLEARNLAREDPAAALACALQAFDAERDLFTKDVDVTILVCRLGKEVSVDLSEEQRRILKSAQDELSRLRDEYEVFFGNYPSLEDVLRAIKGNPEPLRRTLSGHWEMLLAARHRIEEAASGVPADPAVSPREIEAAWALCRSLIEARGIDAAQKDDRFVDAYQTIRLYWGKAAEGVVGRLTELVDWLDPMGRHAVRYREWVAETLSNVALAALVERRGASRAFMATALEEQFAIGLREAVQHDRPHVLIEMAGDGDCTKQTNIRAALKRTLLPEDIYACIRVLAAAAQVQT